ncbi:immunoglobulin lambda-1 light chain-like isoform X3 [Tachysurus fulvidraco]|uniref:immunoglobulin lambda-1 light chain-like isoform X3 n=1 Tax=Tachysurus fulvidraco TaxID=1234273 RepID=UPI001FEF5C51|nr:immunoglobulin lambda-1 light chain-like isoform X3 [Tachysurus fulvidraco]
MLPALCSLFTALACVSGVTVVTHKPPVLTLTAGQTANMDCNLGTVTGSAARWYKQVPGGVPQHQKEQKPQLQVIGTEVETHLMFTEDTLNSSHVKITDTHVPAVSPLSARHPTHPSLRTRVPSHTDTMLPALCSLFTALACVSGVIVVTQKPPVLTLTAGQTANMDCNLGTVTDHSSRWYKQVPGGVPQHVIRHYHEWSSPKYGSGFSSPKFTSTYSSKSDYKLIISNVEVGDSAVYYCHTWDDSAKEIVFGQGTKLIVSDAALPSPVLKLLPPSTEELKTKKATLVCLASDMSVGFADVSWLVDGNSVTSGVVTGSAQQQDNKKFTLSSYLTIDSCEWDNDKVITCEVSAGGKAASVKINKSECSE